MPTVELIYDEDCPNVAGARACIMRAFGAAGLAPKWSEYLSSEAPEHARGLGSPTILVDGADVAYSEDAGPRACCRVYRDAEGRLAGVPEVDVVVRALTPAVLPTAPSSWRSSLGMVPAVASALLPKVACPACWPAYTGVLGSFGLTFLVETRYLLPLTASFLVLAVGMLGFRAQRRRGYGPFAVGVLAAALVLVGKFVFQSDHAMYAGIAILVGASLWNAWPKKKETACSACEAPARA